MQSESSPDQWSKLEKIRYLLDQWDAIFDVNVTSPFGSPGDGSGVALMPDASRSPAVVELQRCLKLLFCANPGDYRHLVALRCNCESRIVWVTRRVRGPQGKMVDGKPKPERRPIIPSWIRNDRVQRAEFFLEEKFRGPVNIPEPFWHAINCHGCPDCRPDLFAPTEEVAA